jgi:cytochrome P450
MTRPATITEPINLVPELTGCPYEAYARLRDHGGVHQAVKPTGEPVWIITRHTDVKALLADPRMSMNATALRKGYDGFGLPPALSAHLMNVDADDHARLRRLVSTAFTPRRVETLSDRIQTLTDHLIDNIAGNGHADLITQYAAPLPVAVISDLLGIPDGDGTAFHTYTNALMTPNSPDRPSERQIVTDIHTFLIDLVARKRAQPGDDLLSAMIAARDGEDRLTENELTSLTFLILWAGFETTVHLIANSLAALLSDPTAVTTLRDQPSPHTPPMSAAVEELMRRDGPVLTSIRRFPTEDLELNGTTIPRGDTVLLAIGSANHDDHHTPAPEQLDFDRSNNTHLGFGHGPHYCLGAPLARLEVRIALWTILRRLPDLALTIPADQLSWKPDYRQHALTTLPVTFTPQSAL